MQQLAKQRYRNAVLVILALLALITAVNPVEADDLTITIQRDTWARDMEALNDTLRTLQAYRQSQQQSSVEATAMYRWWMSQPARGRAALLKKHTPLANAIRNNQWDLAYQILTSIR